MIGSATAQILPTPSPAGPSTNAANPANLCGQSTSDLHPVGYSALYAGSGIGYGLSAAATGLLLTATTPDTVVLIATGTTLVLTAATWLRRKTSEVKKPVAG